MSISIHIPFYNPNPEKKEGYRNLRRFDYLEENVINLKTLSIKNDIFIHTHNDFLDDKNLNAKIIKHKISDSDLNKGYLTWKCRSLMEEQKNDYEYFTYLEHDIKFSEVNLQYWLKYQDLLDHNFKKGDTEGLVNYALSITNVNMAVLIIETKERIKFSFRSTGKFSVNEFAKKYFNGGGHINAAGGINGHTFEIVVADVKDQSSDSVLNAIEKLLNEKDINQVMTGYASLSNFELPFILLNINEHKSPIAPAP